MRMWGAAILLCLAACQPKPAQLSFEGADYQSDAAKVAHGKRLAIILDCTGCHGPNLQGTNLADKPEDGAMYAPNISFGEVRFRKPPDGVDGIFRAQFPLVDPFDW